MLNFIKQYCKENWKSVCDALAAIFLWILVKENILNLSYPMWGYLIFGGIDFSSGGFINVPDDPTLRPGNGSWSISIWAKTPNANVTETFVSKRVSGPTFAQVTFGIAGDTVFGTNGKKLVALFREDGTKERRAISDLDVADGGWHNFIYIADKANDKIRLFRDRIELATTLTTVGVWPTISLASDLEVGVQSTTSHPWQDQLTELAIWKNVVPTQSEIDNLGSYIKFTPRQIQFSSVSLYLPMVDGKDGVNADGDTIRDLSTNGNDGAGDDSVGSVTHKAEEVLSYPGDPIYIIPEISVEAIPSSFLHKQNPGVREGIGFGLR